MLEPLYTADEMRAAEKRYPGSEDELMERAGRAVAAEVLRRWPDAVLDSIADVPGFLREQGW